MLSSRWHGFDCSEELVSVGVVSVVNELPSQHQMWEYSRRTLLKVECAI
jgi:hypothetical protein